MATCKTCRHFAPLSPGHAAICFEKWKGLPWNAAVPLTTADDWCEKHDDSLTSVQIEHLHKIADAERKSWREPKEE